MKHLPDKAVICLYTQIALHPASAQGDFTSLHSKHSVRGKTSLQRGALKGFLYKQDKTQVLNK
jgi:hypothetical protein